MSEELPDVRDGLTRKERVVLWVLGELARELGDWDRAVRAPMLYGRVLEHADMSQAELLGILQRLGSLRTPLVTRSQQRRFRND